MDRLLRQRAPTLIHHLNALRLAGLVRLTLDENEERKYAARQEAIEALFPALTDYLQNNDS